MHPDRPRPPLCRVPLVALLLAFALSLAGPGLARADGFVVVDPPGCDPACPEPFLIGDQLEVVSHKVDVVVRDQVATTTVDQTFRNPGTRPAEGTYVFPVPKGAAVSDFTMWVDGEPVTAKLLDADEARRAYEEIVRTLRDPALLEYVGEGAVQARVFPIPPGGERRIEIAYSQVVPAEAGLLRYRYPLGTERFSAAPLRQASIRVEVNSDAPIRAVYSPTHDIAVDRRDDHRVVVGWEASDVTPSGDFELLVGTSPDAVGANLVSHVDPVTGKGTFLLLAAPGIAAPEQTIAKDVVLVLDTSGSMEGEKLAQAKAALAHILGHLNPDDRFSVVAFSTGARSFADDLRPASDAPAAIDWVNGLAAEGGTDIDLALQTAMAAADPERPTMLLFLTDGLPTEGQTDIGRIRKDVAGVAPDSVRLFSFGVGDDVNTLLLDALSEAHHGRTTYVRPGQPLDEIVSGFYASISAPVLSDVALNIDGATVADVYPRPLPDLFAGSQLVVLGTYEGGGPVTVTLTGKVNGEPRRYAYDGQSLVTSGGEAFLPRLWATRKIGYLLDQIRLNGENPELVKSLVDLSVRYGIVTPYTSYLITEQDILSADARDRVASDPAAPVIGGDARSGEGSAAVNLAQASGSMKAAEAAPVPASATFVADSGETVSADQVLRYVGDRTFLLADGVWTDTRFDATTMTATEVAFASDAYFALLVDHPELAAPFALGELVVALADDGTAYRVTPAAP